MFESQKNKQRLNKAYLQLDAVNREISEKTRTLNALNSRLEAIRAKYPNLPEEEAVQAYFASLRADNETLTKANFDLAKEIQRQRAELEGIRASSNLLKDIKLERESLEQELAEAKKLRATTFEPSKLLVICYTNFDDIELHANVFCYHHKEEYTNEDNNSKELGIAYTSVDLDRTVGFTTNFEDCIDNEPNETKFNAEPRCYLTFSEACQRLGSNIHLKQRVSLNEVHDLLTKFLTRFRFKWDENMETVVLEEITSNRTTKRK